MKLIYKALLLIGMIVVGLYSQRSKLFFYWITPQIEFEDVSTPEGLKYDEAMAWAEHPLRKEVGKVPVFYLYPTSLRSRSEWNATTGTEVAADRFKWAKDWQLPAFDDCCQVYAPFYRQATLAAYWKKESGRKARDLAYSDVLRAFDHFAAQQLKHEEGFILAGHSQGSEHGLRLLKDRILGTKLADKLIVALLPGMPVPKQAFKKTHGGMEVCDHPSQVSCLIAWSVFRDGADVSKTFEKADFHSQIDGFYAIEEEEFHCVNPLTWRADHAVAPKSLHQKPLLDKADARTSARCTNQGLLVEDMGHAIAVDLGGNYHVYDYGMFIGNINSNLKDRIKAHSSRVGPTVGLR